MKKNGDFKKVIHSTTTLLIPFLCPRVPYDSQSMYSFNPAKPMNATHHI